MLISRKSRTAPLLTLLAILPGLLIADLPYTGGELPPPSQDSFPLHEAKVPPIRLPRSDRHLLRSFQLRQSDWVRAQLLADFPERNADAPWLAEAVAVLREAAPYISGEIYKNAITGETIRPPASLIARGRAVCEAGCDDPLFHFIIPVLESSFAVRTPEQMAMAQRRLPDLLQGRDTPHIKLFACGWIWGGSYDYRATKDPATQAAMEQEIPLRLRAALDAAATPEDSLGFHQFIHHNQGYILHYMRWKEAEITGILHSSQAAPWLKDTLLGAFAVKTAWKARGSGYAHTVTDERWKAFREHLTRASKHLTAAWEANPEVPFAAEEMIAVTMAGGGIDGIDERGWFDRATSACFDHLPAYDALLWASRPRWGGSHALMLAFGKACAETRRYDTGVPQQLHKALAAVGSELPHRGIIYEDPEIRRFMVEIERATKSRAKTDEERHYALSFGICNALLARDYALAANYQKHLKEPILPKAASAIASYGILSFEWQGRLAMQADPPACLDLERAETAYRKGDLATARAIYQRLLDRAGVSSRKDAVALVRHRLAAIAVEQRFSTGDWVSLSDEEHQLLWITDFGRPWQPLADGVLSVRNDKDQAISRVFLDARVGLDFELLARMDNPEELAGSQFGCVIGYWPGHTGFATAVCGITRAKPLAEGAALVKFSYDTTEGNPPIPVDLRPNSEIRIRSLDGEVTLWVDQREVFTRRLDDCFSARNPSQEPGKEQHRLGFGSRLFPKGESRIKDIKFRRPTIN